MKDKLNIKYILAAAFFLAAGIVYVFGDFSKESQNEQLVLYSEETTVFDDIKETQKQTQKNCVYICGCVLNPGVYETSEESRLYELVELAGGFTEEADDTAVNLADYVFDGQKIYIPQKGENCTDINLEESLGKVNINTADKTKLMTLPGIGESRAEDILQYRNENGNFKTIEDIKKISGIKEAAFNKIKELICV